MDLEPPPPPKLEHFTILSCNLCATDRDLNMAVFVAQYRKGLKSGTVLVPDSCLFNNPEGCNGLGQKLAILEDFDLDTLNLKLTTDHLWNSLLPSSVDGSRCGPKYGHADTYHQPRVIDGWDLNDLGGSSFPRRPMALNDAG